MPASADFLLASAKSQVAATLEELRKLKDAEFPYIHSADCVDASIASFGKINLSLHQIDVSVSGESRDHAINLAMQEVRRTMQFIGFLLRSTNVRNAFEAYGPLLRMARRVLAADTKLVLSSEWHFSPMMFQEYPHHRETVLVGLPATESGNPLLLPLAGHEFGHHAWTRQGFQERKQRDLKTEVIQDIRNHWTELGRFITGPAEKISELHIQKDWRDAWDWSHKQCTEYFCDLFGLRLFGESYLHAFAYLLAPYNKSKRPADYPTLRNRAEALERAANLWGISVQTDYSSMFSVAHPFEEGESRNLAMLGVADRVAYSEVTSLIREIEQNPRIAPASEQEASIRKNLSRYRRRVPAEHGGGIAAILSAGWRARNDPSCIGFSDMGERNASTLAEILWKSIEIEEIESLLAQP